ncbi:MAG: NAD(P)H-dependent oxidoreductase subunit E [Clostridia bacterium]|nr:NAD(P)H-dependent oxidoreductase subunit E [Clostridia bacterium]
MCRNGCRLSPPRRASNANPKKKNCLPVGSTLSITNNFSKKSEGDFAMKVTVCIGSSCHLKGSRQIVERLQALVAENDLKEKVELSGKFCMGNCQNGVSVTVDDELFSVSPETVDEFFQTNILAKV